VVYIKLLTTEHLIDEQKAPHAGMADLLSSSAHEAKKVDLCNQHAREQTIPASPASRKQCQKDVVMTAVAGVRVAQQELEHCIRPIFQLCCATIANDLIRHLFQVKYCSSNPCRLQMVGFVWIVYVCLSCKQDRQCGHKWYASNFHPSNPCATRQPLFAQSNFHVKFYILVPSHLHALTSVHPRISMPLQSNTDYQKILYEEQSNIPFLEGSSTQDVQQPPHSRGMPWPWIASTLVFAALWVTTLIRSYPASEYGTFEKGFSNELGGLYQLSSHRE